MEMSCQKEERVECLRPECQTHWNTLIILLASCVCVCGLCEHIVFPLVFFLSLSPPLPIITVVLWEFRLQMERVIQRTRYHKIPMVFFSHHFRLIQLFIFIPIFSFRCPCLCSISTRLNLGAGNSGPCDLWEMSFLHSLLHHFRHIHTTKIKDNGKKGRSTNKTADNEWIKNKKKTENKCTQIYHYEY